LFPSLKAGTGETTAFRAFSDTERGAQGFLESSSDNNGLSSVIVRYYEQELPLALPLSGPAPNGLGWYVGFPD
jgi:hypothetical protein